jgi:uncharacterized protein YeaO (DUF488 family)
MLFGIRGRAPPIAKQIDFTRLTSSATAPTRGYRVLVDATWPEGLDKHAVDRWLPELAPSIWLIDHFGRSQVRWGTFRSRYRRQLMSRKRLRLLAEITRISANRPITLITAAPAGTVNHAKIIAEALARGTQSRI